ncbi:MAG: hypothetical protein AAGJ32_06165 [Pseudomonadota bacterium]
MRQTPPSDPARARWKPVGDVLPIFSGLLRASWREIGIIWALTTAGIMAVTAVMEALPLPATDVMGLTASIFPVAFGVAMAAHRMLWPQSPTLAECVSVAARAFPSVLAIVAIRQVLFTFGLSLLVIPSIAVAVFLLLAPIIVMAEAPPITETFRRSVHRVWPIGWAVLALLFLTTLVGVLLLIPIAFMTIPIAPFGEDTLETFFVSGATAAFPLVFTALGVALHIYLTQPSETRH